MARLSLLVAAAALGALAAGPADAHAMLERASPRVGEAVSHAPTELRLWFSEGVEPAFSGVTLTDTAGRAVTTGRIAVDPKDKTEVVVPVPSALRPGTYRVRWHVVSVDTHRTEGDFTFAVKP